MGEIGMLEKTKSESKGKAVWLSHTVIGEAKELTESNELASMNDVFSRLVDMVWDYKIKENSVNINLFEELFSEKK
jgi:hypothetical protein